MTSAADSASDQNSSPEEQLKYQLKVDCFRTVLDTVRNALDTRFNDECVSLLSNMPAVFAKSLDKRGISVLADMFHLDADLCCSEGSVLHGKPDYKDDNVSTLGEVISLTHKLQHDTVYKNFYKLLVVLLTVPLTSASCEQCHNMVAFVKSAVRASMRSHRLNDLVMTSCEK